jgi:hypothetical protein
VANWIKINYERDKQVYIIDLDRVAVFSLSGNFRLTLYFDSNQPPLTITKPSQPEAFQFILNYVESTTGHSLA